jgi:AraC family transcriptional regulator of adaptative response/methylated-DNA-[protein]-cysteine methyltransferase
LVLNILKSDWLSSHIREDSHLTKKFIDSCFLKENLTSSRKEIPILLKGTLFQLKVWRTLLSVTFSELCSYSHIASIMNKATAVRAVATAVARNKIAYFIPCHRIISKSGDFGNYRWGRNLKKILLAFEASYKKDLL